MSETRMSCEDLAERLAPHAVADDDDEVAAHVNECTTCRKDLGALRETLRAVKDAARTAPRDEEFWTNMTRDVRLAYDRAESERAKRRWLGLPRLVWGGLGLAVAGAAALLLVISLRERQVRTESPAPEIAAPEIDRDPPVLDDSDEADVEDVDDDDLDHVLAALEAAEERELGRAIRDAAAAATVDEDSLESVAGEPDPYEAVEDLDDEELERVLAALAKGV